MHAFEVIVRPVLGGERRVRWIVFGAFVVALIGSLLWRASQAAVNAHPTHPAAPTPRADSYEGSSGMGADGFGGYPSRPDGR